MKEKGKKLDSLNINKNTFLGGMVGGGEDGEKWPNTIVRWEPVPKVEGNLWKSES